MIKGRITKGVGGLYTVDTGHEVYFCSARGLFRKNKISPLVGDFVEIDVISQDEATGSIREINERRNSIVRPKAANVDQVVVVFSIVNPELNSDLLNKFLINAERQHIDSVIIINKIDLAEKEDYAKIKDMYEMAGYSVFCTSTETGEGLDQLKEILKNKVSILAGASGVGKSSIINELIPSAEMSTGELSLKISRGKHTTRHTELLKIGEEDSFGFILDTPGFASIDIDGIGKSELQLYFKEFRPYLDSCRFANCIHINEKECIIKDNIDHSINRDRYDYYVKISIDLQ